MKIKFTRKTGFYGMGSSIRLQINGKSVYLNQQDSVEVEATVPLTMQVTFFLVKKSSLSNCIAKRCVRYYDELTPVAIVSGTLFFHEFKCHLF